MNRLAWIAVVALGGLTAFVVNDLLDPGFVPVAQSVELSGSAPEAGPPREGFFVVPPRVIDFREQGADRTDDDPDDETDDETGNETGDSPGRAATPATTAPAAPVQPSDDADDSIDDTFDSIDDSDDTVDDDD